VESSNIGLGKIATEIIRLANLQSTLTPSEYKSIREIAFSTLIKKIDQKVTLSEKTITYIKKYYRKSNEKIAPYLTEEEKATLLG
jgi:hypothetical protein